MSDYVAMKRWRRLAIVLFAALLFCGLVSVVQNRVIQIQRKQVFELWEAYKQASVGCVDKNFVQ